MLRRMTDSPILFYSPGSCSLTGIVVLDWSGRPFRLCRVERALRQTPAFKRVNPQGKVPALRTGGRDLAELHAILMHVAVGRDDLIGREGTAMRDDMNFWLSYLGSAFHVAFYPWFGPQRFVRDEALHPAVKEAAVDRMHDCYAFVENALAQGPYVLGAQKTVLDPYLYAMARWGRAIFDVPALYPRIAAHLARMEEEPSVRFALAIEKGETVVAPGGAFEGEVALEAL